MTATERLKYVNFLTKVNKLGNSRIKIILNSIGNPYDFYNCSQNDLKRIEGIDSILSGEILRTRAFKAVHDNELFFT